MESPPSSPPYLFECPNVACPRAYKTNNELTAHLGQTKCKLAEPPLPLDTIPHPSYRQISGIEAIIHASRQADVHPPPPHPPLPLLDDDDDDSDGEEEIDDEDEVEPSYSGPTLERTFKCPNFGCSKAYKQSNGLKYHFKKGQCDFGVRDIIAGGASEEQAEKQVRPFVCLVDGCERKYRQQNGLMYHYMNSGDHGHKGIALIEAGIHPHPKGGMIPRYRSIYLNAHKQSDLSPSSEEDEADRPASAEARLRVQDEGTEDALLALAALANGFGAGGFDPSTPPYSRMNPSPGPVAPSPAHSYAPSTSTHPDSPAGSSSGPSGGRGRGSSRARGSSTRGRGRPRGSIGKTVSPSLVRSVAEEMMGELKDGPVAFKCPNSRCVRTYNTKHELTYHITLGRCKYKILDGRSRGGTGRADDLEEPHEKTLFACPNAGCGKTYKFKKGLINHLEPGLCSSAVSEAEREAESGGGLNGKPFTKAQMLAVAKPYACQAGGGCVKRYALMHGLRYHYSKSGDHGAVGLELLRVGKHASANGGFFPPTGYLS